MLGLVSILLCFPNKSGSRRGGSTNPLEVGISCWWTFICLASELLCKSERVCELLLMLMLFMLTVFAMVFDEEEDRAEGESNRVWLCV